MLECGVSHHTLHLALYIDEPFDPPAPHERRDLLDGAILRVPSGRLRLYALESVRAEPESDRDADNDDNRIAAGFPPERAAIPPGTYRVTVSRVEYRVPQRRYDAEGRPELLPEDIPDFRALEKLALPAGLALSCSRLSAQWR